MRRFRKWVLPVALAVALLLPLGTSASAGPSDPGLGYSSTTISSTTTGRGNAYGKPSDQISATSDPSDPGLGH